MIHVGNVAQLNKQYKWIYKSIKAYLHWDRSHHGHQVGQQDQQDPKDAQEIEKSSKS